MANNAEFKLLNDWFKKHNLTKYVELKQSQINQLKELDLRGVKIDTLELLQHIPQLKKVRFNKATLPKNIDPLLKCKDDLEILYFNETELTNEQLAKIATLPKLTRLDISGCSKITNILSLEKHQALEILQLDHMKEVEIPSLPKLVQLYHIKTPVKNLDDVEKLLPNCKRVVG